jgi:hypothetical protein
MSPEPALCSGLDCRSLATQRLALNGRSADPGARRHISGLSFSRDVCYARMNRNLVDCSRKRATIPESIFMLSPP